ncbi:CRISPR-associated endoribonuclease Cas6 [Streptococcus sp. zg-86]|uniref:CRISPR-associated endoribonuclease n=1 Tax=Streptococcus zhangguiae TaxID=2664091 RepID=A0A6I4RJR8_9STRE|nr:MULTISPECIES: CRISPR-associated endoribonuclease Cas6 [unclassified Streptococcus]MTB64585.1 CRISPR-associated endoribonuclease Cas6 [Streptococcus sp. zg-86]MTB90895.1 CRISPR-associated endoribonuclease Cas6 [Streptococcus sp. zg-36]MWV56681.1 CRISPR-associated endoribonuclease Cas6 [Streptococcus sp. zg-70]QTH48639.1 CRISPR-associated endoribonuclease Cas6 [Streptococcus sp. zg-86]
MEAKIVLEAIGKCELPINYNYLVQSMIYALLRKNSDFSRFVHDQGFSKGLTRIYKLFTFSQLIGQYQIVQDKIVFLHTIVLQIRSIDQALILQIVNSLLEDKEVELAGQRLVVRDVQVSLVALEESDYQIRMLSPVIARSTDKESGMTTFYRPDEKEFSSRLIRNFQNKYKAYYGVESDSSFSIQPLHSNSFRKVVTKYKNFIMTAWSGDYLISGKPEVLDFLYQVGLGEKNSMGFGMFRIIKKEK